jgi:histidine triad (HIT) family protein
VPHVHFHVLPRYNDTPLQPHARVQADHDKLKVHAEKIIAALQAE